MKPVVLIESVQKDLEKETSPVLHQLEDFLLEYLDDEKQKRNKSEISKFQKKLNQIDGLQSKEIINIIGNLVVPNGQSFKHKKSTTDTSRAKRAQWTKEEDETLKLFMTSKYSGNWTKLSKKLLTKTPAQLAQRWCRVLDPKIPKGHWSKEEVLTLKDAITATGSSKPAVLKKTLLENNIHRSDVQISYQVKKLQSENQIV